MARLKLKQGKTYGDVGDIIARLAGEAQSGSIRESSSIVDEFQALFDGGSEQIAGISLHEVDPSLIPTPSAPSVFVNLHFDRTLDISGHPMRIVNVVVPDFNDKLTNIARQGGFAITSATKEEQDELNKSLFDLSAVAKEAFGFIVICGCAG